MRAAGPILLCALFLLLLLLDAAWTTREGGGCCRWPSGQDQDPSPGWCPGQPSLGHPRCPRGDPLQASFTTPPGTTPPAKDKPTPDWTAFFSFIAVLVLITLGLIAWRYKRRWWCGWRALCCARSFALESSDSMDFQMEDFPQSLLIPLPHGIHPYIESLIRQGVEVQERSQAAHTNPLTVESSEDDTAGGSAVHRALPSHAPEPRPLPDHTLEPRPPSEAALEPGPFPDQTQELIVGMQPIGTPGEEKPHP